MTHEAIILTILAAPLLAAVGIFFSGDLLKFKNPDQDFAKEPRKGWTKEGFSAGLCVAAVVIVAAGALFLAQNVTAPLTLAFPWFTLGRLQIDFGLLFTPLASAMALIVGLVGVAVVLFSLRYMREDSAQPRYWGGLALFIFSMLGLVFSSNLIMLFVFWEMVGFGSYLLIGHNSTVEAGLAANKAMLVNRLADVIFLAGIILTIVLCGSVDLARLPQAFELLPLGAQRLIAGFFFAGVVAKSAQIPLYLWLPEAMEGPTPVSALIHAATMVAAGVYLLCRLNFVFEIMLTSIAWVGAITALIAALCAFGQNSLKRVLAYSTISQLGFMVAGFGLGSPAAAFFHLTTHAFFKALLFLGAGAILTATHHQQDLFKLGGLWKKMPWTFAFFTIGALALAGFPFTAGFLSKDTILLVAESRGGAIFYLLVVTSLLTALYMGRLIGLTFFGKARSEAAEHAHDEGVIYQVPLGFLALGAIFGGAVAYYPAFAARTFKTLPVSEGSVLWQLWGVGIVIAAGVVAFFYARFFAKLLLASQEQKTSLPEGQATDFSAQEPLRKLLGVGYDDLNAGFYLKKMWERTGDFLVHQVGRGLAYFDENFIGGVLTRGVGMSVGVVGLLASASYRKLLTAALYWILAGVVLFILLFSR